LGRIRAIHFLLFFNISFSCFTLLIYNKQQLLSSQIRSAIKKTLLACFAPLCSLFTRLCVCVCVYIMFILVLLAFFLYQSYTLAVAALCCVDVVRLIEENKKKLRCCCFAVGLFIFSRPFCPRFLTFHVHVFFPVCIMYFFLKSQLHFVFTFATCCY